MSDVRQQVQQAIDQLVESGAERGLQVAVYRHGEQVVDAVAGVADPATGRPVASDTVFYNFSIVKGAASTVAHILAERGLFGYDTPVAELWPEFGAHGKQAVTVRQVLDHTAGVPGIPLDTTVEDLCDWDKMCAAIAAAEPRCSGCRPPGGWGTASAAPAATPRTRRRCSASAASAAASPAATPPAGSPGR